jgi:hypothetical protein
MCVSFVPQEEYAVTTITVLREEYSNTRQKTGEVNGD